MYKMDDAAVADMTKHLESIVRAAHAIMENPQESHNRIEDIVRTAQVVLRDLKEGKYRTEATQSMGKTHNS